jgi:hypothetical protein
MSSPAERKSGTGGAAERVKVAATVLALAVARAVVLAASACCLGHAISVSPGKPSLAEPMHLRHQPRGPLERSFW